MATDFSTGVTPNIKKFIGKIIGKIATELYDLIDDEAHRLQTYTYEIAYHSKAFKIFVAKEFDFIKEKLMQREVMLFLLKNLPNDQLKQFIDSIEPLTFEQLHTNKYFNDMFNFHKHRGVMDEMEFLYEENKLKYSRAEQLMVLGSDTNFDYFGDLNEFEGEL
ncbi:MAG: hypothetical protein J7502_06650 [Flavisolibacter sp.]|nr:hypothetical protein [Flavisolibacter sp.]